MVWQDILPVNIYCKAMGTLLNTALAEIISRVTTLEVRTARGASSSSECRCLFLPHKLSHEQLAFRGAALAFSKA